MTGKVLPFKREDKEKKAYNLKWEPPIIPGASKDVQDRIKRIKESMDRVWELMEMLKQRGKGDDFRT